MRKEHKADCLKMLESNSIRSPISNAVCSPQPNPDPFGRPLPRVILVVLLDIVEQSTQPIGVGDVPEQPYNRSTAMDHRFLTCYSNRSKNRYNGSRTVITVLRTLIAVLESELVLG